VKTVAACNEIAKDLRRFAIVAKSNLRCFGIEVVNSDTFSLKENLAFYSESRCDKVFHNFLLGIDRDTAPRQGIEIDAMPLPSETNLNAVMNQAFPLHSLANAHFHQKVDSALLQDAGSYSLLAVLPTTSFDHNRMNSLSVQEV
jgi:hypothetical protein